MKYRMTTAPRDRAGNALEKISIAFRENPFATFVSGL
mgnify:FL=1